MPVLDVIMIESKGFKETYVICGAYINPRLSISELRVMIKEIHDHLRNHRSNRIILGETSIVNLMYGALKKIKKVK